MTDSVTLIVPVLEDRPTALLRTASSVLGQGRREVNLHVLLGDGTPGCAPVAGALARRDRAATWSTMRETSIGAALQEALPGVTTRFCGLLDVGDALLPGTLRSLLAVLAADDSIDLVYSDEQWNVAAAAGDEEMELVVRLKPRFSPHYLEVNDYFGRLSIYRTSALRRVGGWQASTGLAVEWDAALRLADGLTPGRSIVHLPMIAVHRDHCPSELDTTPAASAAAEGAREDGRAAVQEHLGRIRQYGDAVPAPLPGFVSIRRRITQPAPEVSIIIPTAGAHRTVQGEDVELITHCLDNLVARTRYSAWRAQVVISAHAPADLDERLAGRFAPRISTLRLPPGPFNFSTSVNAGVETTTGPLVLLLNDDVIPLDEDWLGVLVATATDSRVGVVGAKLLDAEGRVQHAGVTHDDDHHPSHAHQAESATGNTGHFGSLVVQANYSAMTAACLLTPRDVFEEVGGFWPGLSVAYGDVDYCWKVTTTGRWCVLAPDAVLRHYESSSRDPRVDPAELHTYLQSWADHAHADIAEQFRTIKE